MKINKILLSTKKTALEHFNEKNDFLEDILPADELDELRKGHDEHYNSLNKIKEVLGNRGIEFERTYMPYSEYKNFQGKDLIICVGGDGTVLNSAHYIEDKTPILAVKSSTKSTGALCEIESDEFENALEKILNDEFNLEGWTRAEGKFKGKPLYALNEIFVGAKHSPIMARYELEIDGKKEFQMSSGLVISTGAGSTGWYANISGSGGNFPRIAKELRHITREHRLDKNYELTNGIIRPGQILKIKSGMNTDGCVCFDGDYNKRIFEFNKGDILEVKIAEKPVYVIRLKKM